MPSTAWNETEREDFSHLANPGLAIQQLLKMKAKGTILASDAWTHAAWSSRIVGMVPPARLISIY